MSTRLAHDGVRFLELHASRIVQIAIPVVFTLICDSVIVRFLEETSGTVNLDRPFSQAMMYSQQGVDAMSSIYIAISLIVSIFVVTAILLTLYTFGCIKVILVWMIFSVSSILSAYVLMCLGNIPELLNVASDFGTVAVILMNLMVVGDMAVFWRAPKIVTQLVLIFISILVALVFLQMPDWTVWVLLGLLVIYDACVVLCHNGLLKLLIEKAQERGDEIPALVYSTAAWGVSDSDRHDSSSDRGSGSGDSDGHNSYSDVSLEDIAQTQDELHEIGDSIPKDSDDKDRGVRLGLGDFCFYGILVTRAARLGWDLVILCIFALLMGLGLTLVVLMFAQRPLPALPFSLILGAIFFVTGATTFRPFGILTRERILVF